MELAKLTSKGQITIPIDIRKRLGLKNGDKVIFIEKAGNVMMMNATMAAIYEAQEAFTGMAQSAGISSDDDIISLVSDIRKEKKRACK